MTKLIRSGKNTLLREEITDLDALLNHDGFKRMVMRHLDVFVHLFEFTSVAIGRRNLPIEIVLIKNFLNGMVGDKSDFCSVKATQKWWRSDFVEGSGFADGQDELCEHCTNVGNIGFCLCPEEVRVVSRSAG